MIFTSVTLDIIRSLNGRADSQIIVRVPGGTVGGFTVEMPGAPQFTLHDNVVAFIARWDDGTPRVAGYFQGLSQVRPDRLGNPMLHGGVADGLSIAGLTKAIDNVGKNGGGR